MSTYARTHLPTRKALERRAFSVDEGEGEGEGTAGAPGDQDAICEARSSAAPQHPMTP